MGDRRKGAREKAEKLASSLGNEVPADEPVRPRTPSGILNSRAMRLLLFVVVLLGLLLTGVICILAIWGLLTSETAWRTIATFAIAMVTLGLAILVNEAFGERAGTR